MRMRVIYEPAGRAREYSPWAANLYTGCGHGCLYCYAPKALQMRDRSIFDNPKPRPDVIDKLIKDCIDLRKQGQQITGTNEIKVVINPGWPKVCVHELAHFYNPLASEGNILQITEDLIKYLRLMI